MSHVLVMLHACVLFTSLSRLILRSRILLHEIFVRKKEDLVNLSPTGYRFYSSRLSGINVRIMPNVDLKNGKSKLNTK
jgi:hypothetical protein